MKWFFQVPVVVVAMVLAGVGAGCASKVIPPSPPQVLSRSNPVYPFALRLGNVEGDVLVEFLVDSEGKTRDWQVVRSSNAGFEEAAIEAIKQWTFKPATRNGKPVSARVRQLMTFKLEQAGVVAIPAPPEVR